MPCCMPKAYMLCFCNAGGSASLPWSQQRPPAISLIGSRPSTSRQQKSPSPVTDPVQPLADQRASAVPHRAPADAEDGVAAGGSFQLDAEAEEGGSNRLGGVRRQPLMHPGYFMAHRGPSYTPAPPEALIDARESGILSSA